MLGLDMHLRWLVRKTAFPPSVGARSAGQRRPTLSTKPLDIDRHRFSVDWIPAYAMPKRKIQLARTDYCSSPGEKAWNVDEWGRWAAILEQKPSGLAGDC